MQKHSKSQLNSEEVVEDMFPPPEKFSVAGQVKLPKRQWENIDKLLKRSHAHSKDQDLKAWEEYYQNYAIAAKSALANTNKYNQTYNYQPPKSGPQQPELNYQQYYGYNTQTSANNMLPPPPLPPNVAQPPLPPNIQGYSAGAYSQNFQPEYNYGYGYKQSFSGDFQNNRVNYGNQQNDLGGQEKREVKLGLKKQTVVNKIGSGWKVEEKETKPNLMVGKRHEAKIDERKDFPIQKSFVAEYTSVPIKKKMGSYSQDRHDEEDLNDLEWPDSLKEFVLRSFKASSDSARPAVEIQLRQIIASAVSNNKLNTIDWESRPLPKACDIVQGEKKKKKKLLVDVYDKYGQSSNVFGKGKFDTGFVEENNEIKQHRLERFNKSIDNVPKPRFQYSNVSEIGSNSLNEGVRNWDKDTIVGTSTNLEKRQDLTVQRITNDFTVSVYESHARVALEADDLGEYNQCQTQLKQLYALGISGSEMEFFAYRILYFIYTRNESDINSTLSSMTTRHKLDGAVKHALDVRTAIATSDYHKLFILYRTAPNKGKKLMSHFVARERCSALLSICKAYRPTVSLKLLATELGFASIGEARVYLEGLGIKVLGAGEPKNDFFSGGNNQIFASNMEVMYIDTKAAYPIVNSSIGKYDKVDIKGQVS
ncbi:hypothetical protein BB559_001354 [Furculomyces boomerangus]|uniref:SAC3/GANP/THP3 conserved domain-containing protein n=1 Tax=Furculomyces boomerangus TaxID=61424 RepID=A0A2T9Z271_9FUNG|nr:hypothetical protein BB559_001354 [Furculomyces boomerangus]